MGLIFYGLMVSIIMFFTALIIGAIFNKLLEKIKMQFLGILIMGIFVINLSVPYRMIYVILISAILCIQVIKLCMIVFYDRKLLFQINEEDIYLILFGAFILIIYISFWSRISRYLPSWNIINPSEHSTAFFITVLIMLFVCSNKTFLYFNLLLKLILSIPYVLYIDMKAVDKKLRKMSDNDIENISLVLLISSIIKRQISLGKFQRLKLDNSEYFFNMTYFKLLQHEVKEMILDNTKVRVDDMRASFTHQFSLWQNELSGRLSKHAILKIYLKIELNEKLRWSNNEIKDFILNYTDNIQLQEFEDGLYYVCI